MAPIRKNMKRKRQEEEDHQQHTQTKRKLLLKSKVEVRSIDEGFAGSWHCGTVVECSHLSRVVEYDHYYVDEKEGSENLRETIHVSPLLEGDLLPKAFNHRGIIRPIPPPCKNENSGLNFGLCVDAFIDDGWWEGVIVDYEDVLSDRLVFFPDSAVLRMITTDNLRVTQDWDEVEECWIVRGNWMFLELIQKFPNAVLSAEQIWDELSRNEGFKNNIVEWTCNVTSKWIDLVVETVSQNLGKSPELVRKVISEKVDNYSVNDGEYAMNHVSSCDEEEAVTMQIQSVFRPDELKLLTKSVSSSSLTHEINEGAQEAMAVVVYSDEGILPNCYTANEVPGFSGSSLTQIDDGAQEAMAVVIYSDEGILPTREEDEVPGVGTVVECTVDGSSSADVLTYSEPSLGHGTGMGLSQEMIQTPTASGSTGQLIWLPVGTDVVPEPKFCPEALEKYYMADAQKAKNKDSCARDLQLDARKHLSYMGWRIEYRIRTKGNRVDLRYIPPKGRTPLYSLRGACLQAMDFARRQQVPSLMICRKDQDCASPPPLCLEPQSLYSDSCKSRRTPLTYGKLDVYVEREYCPQAVSDYLNGYKDNGWRLQHGKSVKHLCEKAKKHLSAEGWTFSLHILNGNRRDHRYTNPSNSASYKSLVTACLAYAQELSECTCPSSHELLSNTMHPEVLGNTLTQNGLLLECYTKTSGSSQQSRDNQEVTMPGKRSGDEQLKRQRKSYYPPSKKTAVKRKVSGFQSDDENNETHVPHSSKRARQVVVPRSTRCSPRTILSWLIENNVVLPRAKVRYLSVSDDSAIGQGKINRNGIKCSCCLKVFGLYKFGLHVGSCYSPPSARIYLEDGRSLLDCQKQLLERCSNIYAKKRDPVHKNNDCVCSICHHGGTLLLCDQCPSSFHLNCLGLEDVPDGNWFCPSCQCRICGQQSQLDSDSEEHLAEEKVLCCDQCNHEYHARCLRRRGLRKLDHNNLNSNWFCSMRCEKIFAGLHKLLGESVPVGKDNLSWTILKPVKDACQPFAPSENVAAIECQSKLNVALAVMHECFEPIKCMKRDLIEDVLFNKTSELNRLNFWGFNTVLLEKDDEIISVAVVRIHDEKLAEVPLVCTRVQYRRQGMCRILCDVLEEKLRQLEVERVILPAIPQVLHTWTTSFGFSKMTHLERLEFLPYTFLDFQDTTMCQKMLKSVSAESTAVVPRVWRENQQEKWRSHVKTYTRRKLGAHVY